MLVLISEQVKNRKVLNSPKPFRVTAAQAAGRPDLPSPAFAGFCQHFFYVLLLKVSIG